MRRAPVLLLLALLAACAGRYQTFQPGPLTFGGEPLRLAVDQVSVQSAYRAPGAPPNVEHSFALTPEAAARQLLEHRLRAVGGAGSVQAVILDASVEEQPLETTEGLRGYLTKEPVARLVGRMRVRVDRLDELGQVVSSVSTAVSRTTTIPEDAAYQTRQEIGHELVQDLVQDLDAGLVANLRENFRPILR